MPFFLDNNVLIGYIFETDHWNSKSLAVMNSTPRKFPGNTVLRECSEIYEKNIRIISREFQRTIAEIDPFDVEIILDAHHVGLRVKDLLLITGDYKHIIPKRGIIRSNTSLKDVIGLGDFNPGQYVA